MSLVTILRGKSAEENGMAQVLPMRNDMENLLGQLHGLKSPTVINVL